MEKLQINKYIKIFGWIIFSVYLISRSSRFFSEIIIQEKVMIFYR